MKKSLPYILGFIVLTAIAILLFGALRKKTCSFEERVTLNRKDKIPYGTYVAYENLKYIFPGASVSVNYKDPESWDTLKYKESNQALIIISTQFRPSEVEMKDLVAFAQAGNDVFISTNSISYTAEQILWLETSVNFASLTDTGLVSTKLVTPPFRDSSSFSYPGEMPINYLYKYDTSITQVVGTSNRDRINFIHLHTGKGNVYFHLMPMTFTNYFLLNKKNMAYYNQVMSVINPGVKKVVWDQYYLYKYFDNSQSKEGLFTVLFKYPPLKWGLLTALFVILLYVLLEMRRKQRFIPVVNKPANDSLDFVKTIGRLYYDKKDHRSLCRKMGAYFLEHIRNRYKLSTSKLDDDFIKMVHYKSGYDESKIREIVSFIRFTEDAPAVSDAQLREFYKQLESFYQNT